MIGRRKQAIILSCENCGNGFQTFCTRTTKLCSKKCAYKNWVKKNPERHKFLKKKDAIKRKDEIKKYQKEWWQSKYNDDSYKEKHKARNREYNKLNPGRSTVWAKRNMDSVRQSKAKYQIKNRDLLNKKASQKQKAHSDSLSDRYVRSILSSHGSPMSPSQWPQELVELKRLEIKLKRKIQSI